MRILFYAHSSTLYGANRSLIELIAGLQELYPGEIEPHLIIPSEGPIISELEKQQIPYSVIPHFNWIYFSEHGERWEYSKFLHGLWRAKNKYLKKLKNRIYFSRHLKFAKDYDPDILYVNSSLNPMGLYVGEKLQKKIVWHHRETVEEPAYGYYLESFSEFKRYLNSVSMNIYISKFLKKLYFEQFGSHKSEVIYNYIDERDFNIQEKNFVSGKVRFGMVGRINKQKGQEEIVELFNEPEIRNQNIELHLFGYGDQKLLNDVIHGTENVIYHGFVEKNNLYNQFDVLIANSTNEAFGRNVVEALLNGIPVLAKNSGAFEEILNEINYGRLYDSKEKLKSLIQEARVFISKPTNDFSTNSSFYFIQKFSLLKFKKILDYQLF